MSVRRVDASTQALTKAGHRRTPLLVYVADVPRTRLYRSGKLVREDFPIDEISDCFEDSDANLIMKKVTSWAAIIAVPTAITGFYGQNLPYPGFGKESGLIVSAGLIVGIGVVLYVAFKRWEWL